MIARIGRRVVGELLFRASRLNAHVLPLVVSLSNNAKYMSKRARLAKTLSIANPSSFRRKKPDRPPQLETLPTPIPGLSGQPLNASIEELEADEDRKFKTANQSSAYIDRYLALEGVSLSEEKGESPTSKSLFRFSFSLPIQEELLSESFRGLGRIVGVGESGRMREARVLARIDLAERMYQVLDSPFAYLSEKERKSEEIEYIPVSISTGLRNRLRETCKMLNETEVFQINRMEEEEERSYQFLENRSVNQTFQALSSNLISSYPPPEREGSRLPIWKLYHRLIDNIEQNNVTILSAATGSGKTTQLPQYILDHYLHAKEHYHKAPSVLVTQPRRIAAKTVAQRVADEREKFKPGAGSAVGYTVRFDSKPPSSNADGSVVFCTAGILLRRLQREPDLRSVTHLVLDEVHERDVFTDILLLVVKNILAKRPDLRVILMSATMEANKFVNYFKSAGFKVGQVLDIEGTNYPVKENYLDAIIPMIQSTGCRTDKLSPATLDFLGAELNPQNSEPEMSGIIIKDHKLQEIPFDLIASLIVNIVRNQPDGAILTFLPGWEEITELQSLLNASLDSDNVEIHLLHSTSPIGSTDAAFKRPPEGKRKIIIATNIAESSVTIPDVVYVIDSGKQKVMHYDQHLRMNVLEPCWISKANLRQRLGRAGRCQPGQYFGIYSKARSEILPEQTLPELLRLGLDEVCLNLKAMGFTQSSAKLLATAIDPPEKLAVISALDRLTSIGAVDQDEKLTPLGRLLANIPIHPAMGKMLITSLIFGCLDPVLTTVALLGQKIFRPTRLPHEKLDLHSFYSRRHPDLASDHLVAHKIFKDWKANGYTLDSQMHAYESLLSRPALRRLDDSRAQIFRELKNNFGLNGMDADLNSENDSLVRLILASGFYPDAAVLKSRRNSYKLRKVPQATIVSGSMNHVLGSESIKSAIEGYGRNYNGHRSFRYRQEAPSFVLYEELLDIGQKLIAKTTAVDPLAMILFAERTACRTFKGKRDAIFQQLHVDNWLAFRPEFPENFSDLKLINELRLHWNDFVQFVIHKRLAGEQLTFEEEECAKVIKDTIMMFAKELSFKRGILRDGSVQINRTMDREKDVWMENSKPINKEKAWMGNAKLISKEKTWMDNTKQMNKEKIWMEINKPVEGKKIFTE